MTGFAPFPAPVRSLYLSFIATSTIAGLVLAVTIWLGMATREQLGRVEHTLEVSNQIDRILSLTQSAETRRRGYLLTGKETYLAPYDGAVAALGPALKELGALVSDNPAQRESAERLKQLVDVELDRLRATIETFKAGPSKDAVAAVKSDEGRLEMDTIRALLAAMEQTEQRLLNERKARADRLDTALTVGGAAAFVLLCAVGALGLFISRRAFLELAGARDKLVGLNRDLMTTVGRANRPEQHRRQGGDGAGELDQALRSFDDATRSLIRDDQALREGEHRVNLAHDAALAGVWEWQIEDNRNYWADSLWALYGLARGSCEPSFEAWVTVIHPDDRDRAIACVRSAAQAKEEFEIQWRVNLPAGAPERWLLSRGRPHFDPHGSLESYVGIVIDVSDRRRVEEALRRSERQMSAILGALPLGIALVDTAGRTMIDNEFYRQLVPGFVPSRDQDRLPLWEAYDDSGRLLERENYPAARALRGERVWPGQLFRFHGDQQRGPFWTQVAAIPLRAEDGVIVGATVVIADVDDERRAQEALLASEEEFRAFFETAAVGSVELRLDGKFHKTNARFRDITGYSAEELSQRSPLDITHPDDRSHDSELLSLFLSGDTPTYFNRKRFVRKDGHVVWVEVTAAMVRDAQGRALRTAAVIQDVTERKTAEEALRTSEARLLHASRLSEIGQMAAALAHELNQPLAAIASYMGGGRRILISDRFADDQKQKLIGMMDQANAQSLRAGEIIRRMRDLVRSGETEKSIENARAVFCDAAHLAVLAAKHDGVAVEQDFAECGEVLVDKIQIEQVVLNLVRNAIEAMAATPTKILQLRLAAFPGVVEMAISDTGAGLSDTLRTRLFSPFSSTKTAGMGIGLSVCREIVEAHGGKIWAEANAEAGTTFRFTVPLIEQEQPAAPNSQTVSDPDETV